MSALSVIFEDDQLLVIDKPAGLVVEPSQTQKEETLVERLSSYFHTAEDGSSGLDRMGIVHRLDKDTSGLLLVAKTNETLENLQSQFKERSVKKQYLALVHGNLPEKKVVNAAIERNPGDREKFTVLEEGREAETVFEPVRSLHFKDETLKQIFEGFNKIQMRKLQTTHYSQFTLVACRPLTGRTHQIRVHLKYIGFPIVSDEKYGGRKTLRLDKRWCPRQFLHAAKIEFNHPVSGDRISFVSPLPEDLEIALNKLVRN